MRITLAVIAAALILGYTHIWWLAAGGGIIAYFWVPRPASAKRVLVEDLEKGTVRIQPMDRDTEHYLKTRKDV
jgi:hypothetical protein